MNKAFVDTTILTDVLLKPGKIRDEAKAGLNRYAETQLPVYAIKEFKAGPLKNYVWFYNKLTLTKSYSAALEVLKRISLSPKKYTTSTALEALNAAAYVNKNLSAADLVERYGNRAKLDNVLCDRFRLTIKRLIMKAWNQRRNITTHVVFPLSCYNEIAPYEENGILKIDPTICDLQTECCLAAFLKMRADELRKLKAEIDRLPDKPENKRRAKTLRHLYRTPKRPMTEEMCRSLGDAFFVIFSPPDAVILTTNVRDHEPLARVLKKVIERP